MSRGGLRRTGGCGRRGRAAACAARCLCRARMEGFIVFDYAKQYVPPAPLEHYAVPPSPPMPPPPPTEDGTRFSSGPLALISLDQKFFFGTSRHSAALGGVGWGCPPPPLKDWVKFSSRASANQNSLRRLRKLSTTSGGGGGPPPPPHTRPPTLKRSPAPPPPPIMCLKPPPPTSGDRREALSSHFDVRCLVSHQRLGARSTLLMRSCEWSGKAGGTCSL